MTNCLAEIPNETTWRSLTTMRAGEHGVIAALATDHTPTLHKLMALGVLPGARITVEQTYPSYLFRVGHTQVTVDRTLAMGIQVHPSLVR